MVGYDLVTQYSIMILLGWLLIRPRVRSMEYFDHLVPNQHSICNERVGEWSNSFRVRFKHHRPTENLYSSNHLPIICKVLDTISTVRGITCGNWSYQIIPQSVTERLSIYYSKSSGVLFHRFQSLVPVLWINGRYHFRVLVILLHNLLVIHCTYLGNINIFMCACALNTFELFDIIYHTL